MSDNGNNACTTQSDCNEKGFCVDESYCQCDEGWFGDHCTTNLAIEWPGGFYSFRVTFLIIYSFLAAFVIIRLAMKIRKESRNFGKKKRYVFFITMWSPLNLLMRIIILICLTQILWLAIDPFDYNNVFNPSLERFLFEVSYTFMSMIYAIVFGVWYTIYLELTIRDPKKKVSIESNQAAHSRWCCLHYGCSDICQYNERIQKR